METYQKAEQPSQLINNEMVNQSLLLQNRLQKSIKNNGSSIMNSERESLVMQDIRDVTHSEADSLEPTSQLVNFGFEGIVEEIDPSEKSLYVNLPKKSKIGAKKINPSTALPSKNDDQGSI